MRARKLKERKQKFLRRLPDNCTSSKRCKVNGQTVAFCIHPHIANGGGIMVCGELESGRCPRFKCRYTEEQIEADFERILRSPTLCGDEYPKLAMLIWFLQDLGKQGSRPERMKGCASSFLAALWSFITFKWW